MIKDKLMTGDSAIVMDEIEFGKASNKDIEYDEVDSLHGLESRIYSTE